MGSVAFLSHVPVHVLEPVHPPLELYQVGGVGLDGQVDRGLGLVDHDGEPVLGQGGDITEHAGPEQGMAGNFNNNQTERLLETDKKG